MLPTVPGSPSKTSPALLPKTAKSQRHTPTARRRLQDGMATALSLDHWTVPASSQCECIDNPELSVNFICAHPPQKTRANAADADDLAPPISTAPNLPSAARFQEIFIDLCALHASSYDAASRHVLDSRFDSFLSDGEREFKRVVLELIRSDKQDDDEDDERGGDEGNITGSNTVRLSKSARETSAYRRLERMLRREMGLGTLDERAERRVRKMSVLRRRESVRLVGSVSSTSLETTEVEGDEGETASNDAPSCDESNDEKAKQRLPVDPKIEALRQLICDIRSDDDLFRRFVFLESTDDAVIDACNALGLLKDTALSTNVLVDVLACDSDEGTDISVPFAHEIEVFRRLQRPPGHVFVANGSVCDISCDAFLCPASITKKKDGVCSTVAGTIWRRWYEALRDSNPELMKELRGIDDDVGGGPSKSSGRRRRSRSRSNSAGSDSDIDRGSLNGSGRNRGLFSSIPMKHYEEYDRVCSPKHWPWSEFWRKDEFEAALGGLFRTPFIIAGEVGIERSSINGSKQAVPSEQDHIQSLLETVRQFVRVSLEELRREQPRPRANRERYLLALPVVGTGFGQAGDITGQVVESMMLCLSELVSAEEDVDCVIVCADLATFSHAQNVRRSMFDTLSTKSFEPDQFDTAEPLSSFRLFTPEMKSQALELAKLSTKGLLSLFIGAGVPMGAGLPSWRQLLLAIEDQFTPSGRPEERMLGQQVDPLLVADWLDVLCKSREDRDGVKADIKERIAKFLIERSGYPSLLMYLLASLPTKSIVTQNYDGQIEKAFACRSVAEKKGAAEVGDEAAASESLSVIPYRPVRGAERWLLKMHGCVTVPESIVVTSDDYRSYENGRKKALGGLVQANLLTSHLMFVGFGLEDPNYKKILSEVRKAMARGQ